MLLNSSFSLHRQCSDVPNPSIIASPHAAVMHGHLSHFILRTILAILYCVFNTINLPHVVLCTISNQVFLFIELITGYAVGSLALVADSFHMYALACFRGFSNNSNKVLMISGMPYSQAQRCHELDSRALRLKGGSDKAINDRG